MSVNFTGSYTQTFDTLATTGTTNSSLPSDWGITETGGGARDNEQYAADNGLSVTGDSYSYGSSSSADRALGGLQSGTLIPVWGVSFTNTTGNPITSLTVGYTGEQWRLGATGREDRLDFQYSLDATSLADGTWTDVNTLDFVAPVTSGLGSKDGNATANRTAITTTLTGLNISEGATFWFRWQDLNASGADDGLAIDDFSLSVPLPLIVTNTNDSGAGSLRQAILNANADPNTADTITFSGLFSDGTPDIISLTSDQLSIAGNVTIDGSGLDGLTLRSNGNWRVLTVQSGSVVLNTVTIADGNVTGQGGGIFNSGTLSLLNSTIRNNSATDDGAGILNNGSLTITNSTISHNTAGDDGGGIHNNGTLTLLNSAVSGNLATGTSATSGGGGIINVIGGTATLTNSTISGNTGVNGGGIRNDGTLTLQNVTVTANIGTSDVGGVLNTVDPNTFANLGLTTVSNSIIAGNTDATTSPFNFPDVGGGNGSFTDAGNNLIGVIEGFNSAVNLTTQSGTVASPLNPLLGPLGNNGGLTQTHALSAGSPALDRATTGTASDQRGVASSGTRDIGAFELASAPSITVNLSVSSTTGTEAGTTVITVTATASSAVSGDQTVNLGVSGTGITTGDYSLSNGGVITILNGQTTGTITFTVVNDTLIEGAETATLTLSNPSAGITLGSTISQAITLADNDFPIVNLAAGTNPTEGSTQGTYTLTLNAPAPTGGLTINYSLAGSATTPADYTLAAGTNITAVTGSSFTIAEGQTSATLLVNAVNDGIADPNETLRLTLAPGSGYTTAYNATTPFTAASPVAVGTNPMSVAIGDFNGDGKADFATANFSSNNVSIGLGDGLGGFSGTTTIGVGTDPRSVALGDFNKDSNLDFATANFGPNNVSIRLGDGLGGFSGTITIGVGADPRSVALGDFNKDGNLDFATANFNSNNVSIRLGDGLGGFSGTTTVAVGANPSSVALGDFNGDGNLDFATTNFSSSTVSIRLGDGLGGFSGTTTVAVGATPNSVVIGDFNRDGNLDFANGSFNSNTVSIRLGDGLGGFSGSTTVAVGAFPDSVAIGDFNGDGNLDFATANTVANNVSIRLGDGLGGFSGTTTVAVGTYPQSVAIGDFNGDGKADLVAANTNSNTVSVLLNNDPSATLTIADPPTVNLSVSATTGTEAGTTAITVTATASSAVSGDQTVTLGVSGTGITTGDYSLSNGGVITILNGQTTGTITFTVVNDTLIEGAETATLTLSNPSAGITLGSTISQAITITDNDLPATVYVSPTFTGTPGSAIADADLGTSGNQAAIQGVDAFSTIAAALAGVATNGTIIVNGGSYAETIALTGTRTLEITGSDVPQTVTIDHLSTLVGTTITLEGTSTLRVGDGDDRTLAGTIAGTGNWAKQGIGIITVSGANTYTGSTTVTAGTLQATVNNALGTSAGTTTVASGATLDLANVSYSTPETVILQGGVIANFAFGTTTTFAGNVSLAANSNFDTNSSTLVLTGAVTGDFQLNKRNAGTLQLSNTGNSFSRFNIAGGMVQLGASNVILDTADMSNSSTFDLNGFDETLDSLFGNGGIVNSQATLATLTIGAGNNNATSLFNGGVSGAINVVKTGTGRQIWGAGGSDYTGITTINGGILAVSTEAGGGGVQALGSTAGETIVNAGGTLEFRNVAYALAEAVTLNGGTLRSQTGSSSFGGAITLTGASFINGAGTLTLTGAIGEAGGARALTFNEAGTRTLTGANTYTGTTTINGGTLLVNGSLAAGSSVTVNNTAILSGDGAVNGPITIATGGSLRPGTAIGDLNTGSVTFASGSNLTIDITGTTPITQYDRLNVTGSVNLGNATLNLVGGYAPNPYESFTLIANDGADAISGTFNGLAQGSVIGLNGASLVVNYSGGDGNDVTLTNLPTVNLSVSATAGSEAGTTVITVTATASAAVSGNQTVSLGISGTGITAGDYSLSNSTITIANGQTTGTVTFTIVNDALVEGTETATLTIGNPSAGIVLGNPISQAITITDNDTVGVIITQSGGSTTVTEGGATDSYTIVLASQPTANVTLALNSGTQLTTNPTNLTFTPANWNVAQTVTVTAVDNAVAEGNRQGTITHTATSSDANYNGLTIGSVTPNITDNDSAGVIITQSGGSTTVTETGATDSYTVVLTSQPTANVMITLTNGSQTSTNPTSFVFTAANWNVAQTVTVIAVDDAITESSHSGTIAHAATSSDANYNGLAIASVTAAITDNDTPPTTANASFTLAEDTVYTFSSSHFPFADGDAGDTLQGIRVTQLPTLGQLFVDANSDGIQDAGEAVTVGQDIAVAVISQLKFAPVAHGNGAPYTSLQFQVSDGRFLSTAPGTVTFDVNPVNDLPTGSITLSGYTQQGATLTASPNLADLDGLGTLAWQWQQSSDGSTWANIEAATQPSLSLTQAQVNQYVRVHISYTDGQGTLETFTSASTAEAIQPFTVTPDFDGDNQADIVFQNSALDIAIVWHMDGTDVEATHFLTPGVDNHWLIQGIADFDGNDSPDLVWQHEVSGEAALWQMSGTSLGHGFLLPETGDANWQIVGTGDFNSDDQTDLLWRHATSGENVVWLMNGTTLQKGEFLDPVQDLDWEVGAIGDFTKNGQMEMFWRHRLSGEIAVWEMDGTTRQTGYLLGQVDPQWRMVGAADLTGDAKLDLLWQHTTADQLTVWQMDGLAVQAGIAIATPPAAEWLAMV